MKKLLTLFMCIALVGLISCSKDETIVEKEVIKTVHDTVTIYGAETTSNIKKYDNAMQKGDVLNRGYNGVKTLLKGGLPTGANGVFIYATSVTYYSFIYTNNAEYIAFQRCENSFSDVSIGTRIPIKSWSDIPSDRFLTPNFLGYLSQKDIDNWSN